MFGKPHVYLDKTAAPRFRTAKTEALLYYLSVTGRSYSREALADLLWSDMPETKAKRNLTQILYHLRKSFEPFLIIEAQSIGFNQAADHWIDVAAFEKAAVYGLLEGDVEGLSKAIELYRGDLLEGFYVKNSLLFEEWLQGQRERLRELMAQALQFLVDYYINSDASDITKGIAYARRLLALDPWRETAHRQMMLLLARSGQLDKALIQYQACRRILADELGIGPSTETAVLHERIQLARTMPPQHLPVLTTPFVGREAELAQLTRLLTSTDCRLATLVGLGGNGKTALALETTRRFQQERAFQFLNGITFVSFTSTTSIARLPPTLAETLNLPLSGRTDPLTAILDYLRNKEMLLVLDGFEHLLDGIDFITAILNTCPNVKILVTSRAPLYLEAEYRLDVEGLNYPRNGAQNLADYDAVQLFVQMAQRVNPQFELSAETQTALAQICRIVAGMPLAIKLAAAWLRVMPIQRVVTEVQHNLDFLSTDMRDIPPRQRSIRAVFDSTWEVLKPDEQCAFQALSVFHESFSAEAAAAVACASPYLLANLIDKSLVQVEHAGRDTRYQLHELLRQYAISRLRTHQPLAPHIQAQSSWRRASYARH
ncbi:MAG: AAA family ATPase [Chloroflexales bacterium]|nr:AAA family ATPase [Chloroflexales bacterium]